MTTALPSTSAHTIGGVEHVYELRLFGVFGPHEDWRVRLISSACCRALWDLPAVMGQNVFFDCLDVEDLGRILDCFATASLRHWHYSVSTGRAVDLKTLVEKVVAASGKQGLGNGCSGDSTGMLAEVPDFRFRDVDESVARLYRWYEERRSAIDPALLRFDGVRESL